MAKCVGFLAGDTKVSGLTGLSHLVFPFEKKMSHIVLSNQVYMSNMTCTDLSFYWYDVHSCLYSIQINSTKVYVLLALVTEPTR